MPHRRLVPLPPFGPDLRRRVMICYDIIFPFQRLSSLDGKRKVIDAKEDEGTFPSRD